MSCTPGSDSTTLYKDCPTSFLVEIGCKLSTRPGKLPPLAVDSSIHCRSGVVIGVEPQVGPKGNGADRMTKPGGFASGKRCGNRHGRVGMHDAMEIVDQSRCNWPRLMFRVSLPPLGALIKVPALLAVADFRLVLML
jgi:hypothetical protein